jgi:hypothetical protein
MKTYVTQRVAALIVAAFGVGACAIPVRQVPLAKPIELASGESFTLSSEADFSIGTGYSRTLRSGTHWTLYGSIDAGKVFRSPHQALTVEGYNVHEAYLVIKDNTLIGFYLPVEKTFTPISKAVPLSIENLKVSQK